MATSSDLIVSRIDKARVLLAEARDAPAAKKVKDAAHYAELLARRQKLSREVIGHAHALEIDAQRLMGEYLLRGEKNRGGGEKGVGRRGKQCGTALEPHSAPLTYAQLGIDKKEAADAQTIANIAAEGNGLYDSIRSGKKTVAQAKREFSPPPPPKTVPISETFYQSMKGLIERLEGIKEQYGSFEKMFESPLWQKCDTQFVVALIHEARVLFVQFDKEVREHEDRKKKLQKRSRAGVKKNHQ